MACDATTIQAAIATNGLDKLSERDLLICIAGKLGSNASLASSTTALAQAYSNGLPKLSYRDLLICLASIIGTNAGFANAQAAINQDYANKLPKLSDRELWAGFMVSISSTSSASTLITAGMAAGYGKLSELDLIQCMVTALSNQSSTTTIGTAMTNGYGKLSERDLMECIVAGECAVTSDITNGLLGWWKLDEGSGTSAADSSTNANTGTLVNTPTWISTSSGFALHFVSASHQYVSTTNVNKNGLVSETAWIRVTANPASDQQIMGYENGLNSGTSDKRMYFSSLGKLSFSVFAGGSTVEALSAGNAVTFNVWHNVVGTWDGNDCYVYLDGVQIAHTSSPGAGNSFTNYTVANIFIAASSAAFALDYFNGDIDDVRVYNRALSSSEVSTLFNNGPK